MIVINVYCNVKIFIVFPQQNYNNRIEFLPTHLYAIETNDHVIIIPALFDGVNQYTRITISPVQ
jgi:hypothetical protein